MVELSRTFLEVRRLPVAVKILLTALLLVLLAFAVDALFIEPGLLKLVLPKDAVVPGVRPRELAMAVVAILASIGLLALWTRSPAEPVHPCGLLEIRESFQGLKYDELILGSSELTVILNDGRSWVPSHRELLRRRFSDTSKVTRFCFIHPESPYLPFLVAKNDKDLSDEIAEIIRSIEVLTQARSAGTNLEIRGHMRPTPYCAYMNESEIWINPYFFAEAGALPVLRFRKGPKSLYASYRTDIEGLLQRAERLEVATSEPRLSGAG